MWRAARGGEGAWWRLLGGLCEGLMPGTPCGGEWRGGAAEGG